MPRVTQDATKPHSASITGLSPSVDELSRTFFSPSVYYNVVLQPRGCVATTPVWALPRSLATTGGIIKLFSLPPGTKMFQFPGFASPHQAVMSAIRADGLSHSEIPASMAICAYTGLIAAYHVLHRLREPRHPPCALFCFAVLHYTPPIHGHGTPRAPTPQGAVSSYFQLLSYTRRETPHTGKKAGETPRRKFSTVLIVSTCQRSLSNA